MLIDHLPPESAYQTAVREAIPDDVLAAASQNSEPGPVGSWSHLEMLLARLIDEVAWLRHQHGIVHGSKAKPPEPVRRPGVAAARDRVVADMRGFQQRLAAFRAGGTDPALAALETVRENRRRLIEVAEGG